MEDLQNKGLKIRWAMQTDWEPAMQMIWKTFMKFEACDYTQEGIDNFKDFITNGQIYRMFKEGTYLMMVALHENELIGAISVRNRNHISLLFVDEAYHKQGVGRQLMNMMSSYLKHTKNEIFISVKAAPYAVGFYRKLGFRICEPEQELAGIRVTSMEKFL